MRRRRAGLPGNGPADSDDLAPYQLQVPYDSFQRQDALPLAPGEIAELTFGLQPTSVLIRQGHPIRIAIAGHEEGTFVRIPAEATATITVARNSTHASYIDLPAAPRDFPEAELSDVPVALRKGKISGGYDEG